MENTSYHAGSATGIDLAALTAIQDRLAMAYRLCLSLAPKQAVGELLETATNMPEWETVRAALARATPQHSVTEQGKPVAYVNGDELGNMLDDRTATIQGTASGWRKTPLYAQPLASTAATQPEQASKLQLFSAWKGCPLPEFNDDGNFDFDWLHREWVAFNAGLARAALAIPAATAASEQPDEFAHIAALSKATTRPYKPAYEIWLPHNGGAWVSTDERGYNATSKGARRIVNTPVASEQQGGAIPGLLNADELAALRRFDECAQDGEGYDVPQEMMQRLAEIGVVRRKSGRYYQATEFGQAMLAATPDIATTVAPDPVNGMQCDKSGMLCGATNCCPKAAPDIATTAADQQGDTASDAAIEAMFKDAGGRWDGNYWVIEDADLHPFIRAVRAQQGAAQAQAGDMVRDLVKLWDAQSVSADDYNDAMCGIEARMRTFAAMAAPATSNGSKA